VGVARVAMRGVSIGVSFSMSVDREWAFGINEAIIGVLGTAYNPLVEYARKGDVEDWSMQVLL
jgi:hypothetical protein